MSIGVAADGLEDAIMSELRQSIPCQLKMNVIILLEVNHGPFIYNHLTGISRLGQRRCRTRSQSRDPVHSQEEEMKKPPSLRTHSKRDICTNIWNPTPHCVYDRIVSWNNSKTKAYCFKQLSIWNGRSTDLRNSDPRLCPHFQCMPHHSYIVIRRHLTALSATTWKNEEIYRRIVIYLPQGIDDAFGANVRSVLLWWRRFLVSLARSSVQTKSLPSSFISFFSQIGPLNCSTTEAFHPPKPPVLRWE